MRRMATARMAAARMAAARMAAATMVAAVALTLAACGRGGETVVEIDDDGGFEVVEGLKVDGTRPGEVKVPLGQRLVVDFGDINNSVGDDWFLVGPADPAVLADEGDHYDSECSGAGCGAHMWWEFDTVATGTTDVTFRFCYRSRPDDCEPMDGRGPAEPVTLTVTVTP